MSKLQYYIDSPRHNVEIRVKRVIRNKIDDGDSISYNDVRDMLWNISNNWNVKFRGNQYSDLLFKLFDYKDEYEERKKKRR